MRTSIKYVLLFFALVTMIGIGTTLFSGDSEARLCVWDGGDAGALASTAANWDTDTAPVAGDDVLFDGLNATGDDACTWDLATNSFGTFTIGAGYSGTITQSSDMYIQGYSQSGGVFTPINSKFIYLGGNLVKTAGTFGINAKLTLITDGIVITPYLAVNTLTVSANVTINDFLSSHLIIDADKILTIASNKQLLINYYSGYTFINNGLIYGANTASNLVLNIYNSDRVVSLTGINCYLRLRASDVSTSNRIFTLTNDNDYSIKIDIFSLHASYTTTLNLNGHFLTATTITIGTRGILDCGNGTITCSALTSTSGTIIEDTATWIFNDGAVVTATSGEKFYNVQMKGDCDFVNAVNVTNELRWIDVPVEYGALDVYLDSIYSQTIPSYTFGPEQTAAAEYSYLPDVQIEMSQFYEDIDFSIYAYISTNLPVTYNITGTASGWLSYHEGRIVGMPPDIGNYTYTITATHASGSVDVVNGYILVGSLSTAEYSYDQIWGLILWIVITAFMLIGLLLNVPLIQIVAFMGTIGSIVASLRIPEFEVFLMMFALGNSALFFIGMVRYRR